ncbi:hypothetical protein EWM64_g2831 [Hericium alpestre]|uniref:Uncharacterized protein n=1 Tax=Hericium alpestre TaxID=135208 RepID=A0A4Z0A5I0_9AGAM|nr:hypothetical protein EWM64_g2831 [Hericium alpestre]
MTSSPKVENMFSVEGRVALITVAYHDSGGGAGGLGALMAEGLVANGARVYLVGRKEDTLKVEVSRLDKISPGKARHFAMDITVEEDVDKLVKFIEQYEDSLDFLVNNAGLSIFGPPASYLDPLDKLQANLKEPPLETWKACLATNSWAPYTLTVSFLHLLARAAQKGGRGSVLFITASGTQSWNPNLKFSGYISTRVGAEHIARILAAKLTPHRIRVNVVVPGIFPSIATRPDDPQGLAYPNTVSHIVPFKRAGFPEELIGTIIYLASAASGYMTGERIAVDGGFGLISNGTNKFLPDGAL